MIGVEHRGELITGGAVKCRLAMRTRGVVGKVGAGAARSRSEDDRGEARRAAVGDAGESEGGRSVRT